MRTMGKKALICSAPITAVVFLSACGGGGGDGGSGGESAQEVVQLEPGAFSTTIQFEGGGTSEAIAFLSPSGKFVTAVRTDDDVTLSNISFSAPNTLSGTGLNVVFLDGSYQSTQGQLNGTVSSTERATIDVTAPGYSSVATLKRENQYSDSGADFSQISRTYTESVGRITTTITVASDGTITGSDTTGCAVNGAATIPDPQYNVLEIDVTVANCGELSGRATANQRNGNYSALCGYDQSLNQIQVGCTNGDVTLIFVGNR
jgi:hypothetical protein